MHIECAAGAFISVVFEGHLLCTSHYVVNRKCSIPVADLTYKFALPEQHTMMSKSWHSKLGRNSLERSRPWEQSIPPRHVLEKTYPRKPPPNAQ